jgi:hypothetical protein
MWTGRLISGLRARRRTWGKLLPGAEGGTARGRCDKAPHMLSNPLKIKIFGRNSGVRRGGRENPQFAPECQG